MNQFSCWFSTDTDGYWLHAASMTGHRWGDVAKDMPFFYSWGYSVLLTIPMMITEDVNFMYSIAIIINVLLCTLIVPIVYYLCTKFAPGIARIRRLLIALIVSCYSSYILNSAVSLAETLIYFLTFLILFLLYKYFDSEKVIWAVLSGCTVGYVYIVHNRCIGLVVAFVVVSIVHLVVKRKFKAFLGFMIPFFCMLVLKNVVTDWLNVVEQTTGIYTVNTYDSVLDSGQLSFYNIISLIQNVIGELWYTLAGTFVIAGYGIYEIIKRLIEEWGNCKFTLFYVYAIISWIFMIGVSSLFLLKDEAITFGRIDTIFYGRYMESSIGFLLMMGLIYLEKKTQNKKEIGLVLIFSVLLTVLVYFFTKEYDTGWNNWFSMVAILFPFSYGNTEISVLNSSIVLLIIGLFVIYLFGMGKNIYKYIAYVVVCVSFLFIGYNATYTVARLYREDATVDHNPTYNDDFVSICDYVSNNNCEEFYVLSTSGYEAFSYQFIMQDKHVISVIDTGNVDLMKMNKDDLVVVLESKDISRYQYDMLYDGEKYNLIQLN